jgi:calpain-7
VQTAKTQDEALTLAINAADNLMKALKLTSDAGEKKILKSQCREVIDLADRIKKTANWTAYVPRHELNTEQNALGQRTADVTKSGIKPESPFSADGNGDGNDALRISSLHTAPSISPQVETSENSTSIAASQGQGIPAPKETDRYHRAEIFNPLMDLSERQSSLSSASDNVKPLTIEQPQLDVSRNGEDASRSKQVLGGKAKPDLHHIIPQEGNFVSETEAPPFATSTRAPLTVPLTAAQKHVKRLKDPISTRKHTKKEDILLLRASVVNGFKFPPWEKNPSATEFALEEGAEAFT